MASDKQRMQAETGPADDAVIGRALRRSLAVAVIAGLLVGGWLAFRAWNRESETSTVVEAAPPRLRERTGVELPQIPLRDVTAEAGIVFSHENGAAGEKLLPETMGGGVAWLDYDNDGDQDLLFVNSTAWPWTTEAAATSCRLYANDGSGKFADVTAEVGLEQPLYGMGVAVGDYDNDGWTDLFLSAVGPNRLLRNDAGKFRDVTERAGVAGDANAWGTSCGFLDYDNDGLLDLVVCNYVEWSRELDLAQSFSIDGENRAYGPPRAFRGTFSYLYHNEGEGQFRDVSEAAGLHVRNRDTGVPLGKAMGLAPIDVNADGFLDLVIANDTVRNFLLINERDGRFSEQAELCGIAYDRDGNARGAMGIDAVMFREDGTVAVGIGNFANEPSALYMAAGPTQPQFNDLAMATGLGPQTRLGLTFGLFFFDVDLDGRLDLLGANGHLEEEINKVQSSQHYAQPPQLFWNAGRAGGSQMIPLGEGHTGSEFHQPIVGRGAAYADIDADGDLDFVLAANGGPPRLFRNDQELERHWLRFELEGVSANRSAIGARVELDLEGRTVSRVVMPTRSYLSQCELPVTFGLGAQNEVKAARIYWPGGGVQTVPIDRVDRTYTVRQSAVES
jgi:hypothetical protein